MTVKTRASSHHRLRPGRLHGRDLCGARHAEAGADRRPAAGRPADDHHRCRELSGLRRPDPGPLADGADAEAGRACRHRDRQRHRHRGRPRRAAVPAEGRFRHRIHLRRADHRDRRAGQMAGHPQRAAFQGFRRLGLRHLRRLLLPRQGRGGGRRRQFARSRRRSICRTSPRASRSSTAAASSAPSASCRSGCSARRT